MPPNIGLITRLDYARSPRRDRARAFAYFSCKCTNANVRARASGERLRFSAVVRRDAPPPDAHHRSHVCVKHLILNSILRARNDELLRFVVRTARARERSPRVHVGSITCWLMCVCVCVCIFTRRSLPRNVFIKQQAAGRQCGGTQEIQF